MTNKTNKTNPRERPLAAGEADQFGRLATAGVMRWLLTVLAVLAQLLFATAANAVTYTFPGSLPSTCTGTGPNYTCIELKLNYQDVIIIAAPSPAKIQVNGDMLADTQSLINDGVPRALTITVTGAVTLGNLARIGANVIATSVTDASGAVAITGSLTTTGDIQLGYKTTVDGNVTTTSGAIKLGDNTSLTGDAVSKTGSISSGYQAVIKGSITTAGVVNVGQNALVGGKINAGAGNVNVGYQAQVGNAITTSSGTITIAQEAVVSACVKSTAPAKIILGYLTKVNSVCCGTACDNSCVGLDGSIQMPPLCGAAPVGVDHYELSLPSSAVRCLPITVTVNACADSSSPCTKLSTAVSGNTVDLLTSVGTLGANQIKFDAAGVATTSLSNAVLTDSSTAAVTASGMQLAATNTAQFCANGSTCSPGKDNATVSGGVTFDNAGFVITNVAGGSAVNVSTQIAGTPSAKYFLRAVKSASSSQACEPALTSAAEVSVAYECNNPTTCSANNKMTVNTSATTGTSSTKVARYDAGAVGSGTPMNFAFDSNGNAPFDFVFGDAGRVTLHVSKAAGGSLLVPLSGKSNAYVTRPALLTLSNVVQSAAPNLPNPAAADSSGPVFVKAGEDFGLTIKAVTAGGEVTPNFGREITPENVLLVSGLVAPTTSAIGTLSNDSVSGSSFKDGVATVTNLAWSDVGIIRLTAALSDARYIGTSNVASTATGSGNIGRFYPHHFDTVVTPACVVGAAGFTYSGQPMTVAVMARNLAGATTTNYSGASTFAKTVTLTDANAVAGAWKAGNSFAASGFVNGVASSAAPVFTFTTPKTIISAVKVRATDSDAVTSSAGTEGSASIYSGRLLLMNAYGSELLDLPVPLTTQFWNGSTYVTNTFDNCTALPVPTETLGLIYPTGSKLKGNTKATMKGLDTGSPTVVAGNANLKFGKPGKDNTGYVDITLQNPIWLPLATPAPARASFGVFKSPIIYRRENY